MVRSKLDGWSIIFNGRGLLVDNDLGLLDAQRLLTVFGLFIIFFYLILYRNIFSNGQDG